MKFLLAIIVSTAFASSAFAACGVSTPNECTTKASCDGLSTADGPKFEFNEAKSVKCTVKEAGLKTALDCNNKDGKYGKSSPEVGAAGKGTSAPVVGK